MKQAPVVTPEDLVNYGSFDNASELPENSRKLIQFASDMVMCLIKNNYNPSSEAHVLAVKKAICSQVSYWVESGTNPLDQSNVSSYSLGELSVTSGQPSPTGIKPVLCRMSMIYLNDCYLLYRGLRHARI